jgi:hypothetical protein
LAERGGNGPSERRGHTEAAVDLARPAGLAPAGVICEILAADGSMARGPQLAEVARRYRIPLISVADLVAHRLSAAGVPMLAGTVPRHERAAPDGRLGSGDGARDGRTTAHRHHDRREHRIVTPLDAR